MSTSNTNVLSQSGQLLETEKKLTGHINKLGIIILGLALLFPFLAKDTYHLHTAVIIINTAIAIIGLMIISRVGQLSFCHAAFAGIGAYGSAIFSSKLGIPPYASLFIALAIVILLSACLGWLILRIRGVYFVLITFAFGQLLGLLFIDLEPITGGAVGLSGIPIFSILGLNFDTPFSYFYFSLFCLLLVIGFVTRLLNSNIGRAFDSISNNVKLAESSGIATHRKQILAFTIGSALAALSGVLSALYTQFVTPGSYENSFMVSLIVMLVLGGRQSIAGAIIGAAFIIPLAEILRDMNEFENILYGVVVLLTLRFVPGGLSSIPERLRQKKSDLRGDK